MAATGPFEALDDLTAEELRQRLQSLQTLIARVPVPIAIAHDPECRFISANRALAALLRMPLEANISLTPPAGIDPPYRIQRNGRELPAGDLPMQYAIAHHTAVSNEIEIVLKDGTVLHVQNDVEPLFDTHGHVYGCVSVCVDLTERKIAEDALRDADRRKDEFLATLSHELRSPLAPIRTAIEVMRIARDNAELVEKARVTMERQLLHLVRITDDLLDVSRITQDKLELRRARIDLRSAIQSAVEATRPAIDAYGHRLTIDVPTAAMWVDADPTRLAQAFSNLLNNAVKYTERGGAIQLTAAARGDTAKVTVADTGIGIPPQMLPRIFDMFLQLQPHRDRTHGGLGIGLSLAKRLVELHGGRIDAHSDGPGRGSRFVVQLPLTPAYTDAAARGRDEASALAPRRVLIAEDSADAAEMLRVMLRLKGHDVRVAEDGARAVALAEAFDPQIAFVDIGMPGMDGYEAARRIRALLGRRVVLVALTGWGQDEDQRRSREAGFDHHLTKPPEPEILERLIADCVSNP
jgi:signal transduction histidine kinase